MSETRNQFLAFALLAGVLATGFAVVPQIDLFDSRGGEYNGVYAVIDYDEPFYAAYIQSQIDGKPFRNSPFTGTVDSSETPQYDSYLSIQFFSTYPVAIVSKLTGMSISTTMIALLVVCCLISAAVVYFLFYAFTFDVYVSFIGTLAVLLCGGIAGGQGGVIDYFNPGTVQYTNPLLFLRRSSPAMSFPVLFLFFFFVWRIFTSATETRKNIFTILAIASFAFTVYCYFYHWTTALAWLIGLLFLCALFRFEDLRAGAIRLSVLSVGVVASLIPYLVQLSNRAHSTDSTLFLVSTHQPDPFRIPEIISYVTIAFIGFAILKGIIDVKDPKVLFLLSFALVPILVFNQQVVTGQVLQPFHYELFAANYISLFAFVASCFFVSQNIVATTAWPRHLLWLVIPLFMFGIVDSGLGLSRIRSLNVARDQLLPIAERVRSLNQIVEGREADPNAVLLSFDFVENPYISSNDFPSLCSQPVLWSPHIAMFPDVDSVANRRRLFQALYYQAFDEEKLRFELKEDPFRMLSFAVFGGDRVSKIYNDEMNAITEEELNEVIREFGAFIRQFDYEDASRPRLSYVLVDREVKSLDLSSVDRWYQRDEGEQFGKFVLYRVNLRERK